MSKTKEQIILIDDEKRMCDSLAALLTKEGFAVKTFQDPIAGTKELRKSKADLVITDIKMPKMDGMQILKEVKEIDEDIPVILMTGFGTLESAVTAISQGAYDYLIKPVEFAQFQIAVKRALEKRRSSLARKLLLEELSQSNENLNRKMKELNALYEAGKSIGSTMNLEELLRQIVSLATQVTGAKIGSIMILNDSKEYLTIKAAIGLDQKIVKETRLSIGESIAGYVAETGEPLIIDDVESHKKFKRRSKERYGHTSLVSAPLKIKNKVIGVINMSNKLDGAGFDKNDLRILSTFASQAAVAIDDANHYERNRRRLIEFEILNEFSTEMANIDSMNSFRLTMVSKLKRIFPIDYSIWFTWHGEENSLIPQGASGMEEIPLTESGGIDLNKINQEEITFSKIKLKQLDLSDIGGLSSEIAGHLKKNKHYPNPTEAFMAIPIIRHKELQYIACFGSEKSEFSYSDDDISLARLVISQAGLLLEKERSLLNSTRLLTMGNMISEISHDLRRPLTSIRGGIQILREKLPDDMKESELFINVEEEVHRLNELVRELLDFSNPNKYETEKMDLRKVVGKASELVKPDMKKKNIEFSSEFDDANWDIIINKNQVMEALLNIFMNAIDAMQGGGRLEIKGYLETPDHKKEEYLTIKIADSGVGIKKENLSHIFDRYYTTKESGTGLGLAVVERIMSAHNGTLNVTSEEGKGTTFKLYFPYSN